MKVLITGAGGFIGRWFVEKYRSDFEIHSLYGSGLPEDLKSGILYSVVDITNRQLLFSVIDSAKPDAIVHAAAVSSVSACERNRDTAYRINVAGTENVANAATRVGAYLVYLSTDMVFDGSKAPYSENDPTAPLSHYGATKAEGESRLGKNSLALRLSLGYGKSLDPTRRNFFEQAFMDLKAGKRVAFFNDEWRTSLWVGDTVSAIAAILRKRPAGIMHLGGPERMSRADMAIRACEALGLDKSLVEVTSRLTMRVQERPADLTLDTSRFQSEFRDFRFTRFEESLIQSGLGK